MSQVSTNRMAVNNNEFPFEIKDLEPAATADLMKHFTGERTGYVRVGPKGYFMPKRYEREAALYYNMPVRPSDVFVVSFPRSGTTLTQELVWLIGNDLDFKKASESDLAKRFQFLEFSALFNSAFQEIMEDNRGNEEALKGLLTLSTPATERLACEPSPRFIKSHLPLSLLPPALDTARVVYVARDPRDVAVSFFHHNQLFRMRGYVGDFKTYWNYFINDMLNWTPFFEHVKEGWEKRHNANVLFLFYEDLIKNQPSTIRKVAKFLNKPEMTDEQVSHLMEHLSLENFKKNKSVNEEVFRRCGLLVSGAQEFIRKGQAGGWREYFDEEMTRQAERWIADNLRGTDLHF